MKLPELGVRRPVTTAMIFFAIVILGFVSLTRLGLDLMPDIETPAVSVITAYKGAGPEEVEKRITEVMEERLSTVPKVDEVRSISMEGLSVVTVKFDWGVNLDEATNDVRDKVDLAKAGLPDEADSPVIFKFDLSMFPVVVIGVTAEESWETLDRIVDDRICDTLKRIAGVATAIRRGGLERQILVRMDRQRMEAFGLSVNQINASLAAQNLSNPGGHLKVGYKDYLIRTPEEFSSPEEVGEVVLAHHNGIPIRLKDVAEVIDGFKEKTQEVRIDAKHGMMVIVQKQSGENTVAVAGRVKAELERIRRTLPPDINVKVVMDSSDFIRSSIKNLRNTLMFAGIFVLLIVLFFLRNIRASLIVATAIPTSLIITFVLMFLAGYTINTITLSSLAIAMGIVLDNSIVILDNIHRHRERGQKPSEGAIYGANEVGMAVVASTLTTVAIFAPIIFVGGITAILFGQLAAVITMALMASLFTALTLVPMLCSKFLRVETGHSSRFFIVSERMFTALEGAYARFLGWSLSHKRSLVGAAVLLLVLTLGMVRLVGTEFMPEEDQNQLSLNVELPIGTRYEKTGAVCQQVQKIGRENVPELVTSFVRWGVGELGIGSLLGREEATYTGRMGMRLITKTQRIASPRDIIERIRPLTQKIPGAEIRFSTEDPLAGLIFGGGKLLTIDLYGYDLEPARRYARSVANALRGIRGVTDIEISRKEKKPELKVVVDREKSSSLGLNVTDVGKTVETLFSGTNATKYREAGDEYNIEVRLRDADRMKIEDLRDASITAPGGRQIKLSSIADIQLGLGPTKIERKDQSRYITVSADIQGRDLGSVVKEAEDKLANLPPPAGFTYKFAGAEKEKRTAFRLLFLAALLGMILVYMVMASQFESLRDPFIILFSLPFGFIGVVWILVATGQRLSVISFLGIILLIGIVVNNGIVLISSIGTLRRRGLSVKEAIMKGGRARLRPVLCTSLTTIFGMLPLALSRGEGSEVWVPMALSVIGGLSLSTLVTLILMPTLYSIFEERRKRKSVKIPKGAGVK